MLYNGFLRYFVAISLSFVFVVAVALDSSPTNFPLPKNYDNIDCFSIHVENVSAQDNRIHIEIETDKLRQFPQNAAPLMLKIETKINNFHTTFVPPFWDLERNESRYSFNIIQKSSGNATVSISCQKYLLETRNVYINSVTVFQNIASTIIAEINNALKISNVCIKDKKFQFITEYNNSEFSYHVSSNETVDFEIITKSISKITNENRLIYPFSNLYVLSSNYESASDVLINSLLPLYIHIQNEGHNPVYLLNPNKNVEKVIKKITTSEVISSIDYRCSNFISFIPAIGAVDLLNESKPRTREQHIDFIISNITDPQKLRNLFNSEQIIDENLIVDLSFRNNKEPSVSDNFVRFDRNSDILEIIETISKAKTLIVTYETYLFAYFIPSGSNLVDLSNSQICKEFAERINVNYQTRYI